MLVAPATANTKEIVDALLTEQTREGRTLDYKRDLNIATDADKRELARDVVSFANAGGGFLVFGIEEARDPEGKTNLGYPAKLLGVECPNYDATVLRLESIVSDQLDPKVQGVSIHKIDGYERGPILIVHIPRSWSGPHMLASVQSLFFSRNNSGKRALDVHEIRAAFLAGSDTAARIRNFRDGRLGKIVAGETPVSVEPGPLLVVHVVPVASDVTPDLKKLQLAPVRCGSGYNTRHNLDGLCAYVGSPTYPSYGYSMAFRDGAFEGVLSVGMNSSKGPPTIYGCGIETDVLDAVEIYVGHSRAGGYGGPLSVLVALVNVKGARVVVSDQNDFFPGDKPAIDRDVVTLPDVLLEQTAGDYPQLLKPAFDGLWQASGEPRSYGYTEQGQWIAENHPRRR